MPKFRFEDFSVKKYESLGYTLIPQKGMNMQHILSNTETTVSLLIRPQSDDSHNFTKIDKEIVDVAVKDLQISGVVSKLYKSNSSDDSALIYVMDTSADIVELICWIQKTLFSKFYQHVRVWALTYSTNKVLGDYTAVFSYKVSAEIYRNVDIPGIEYFIDHNVIHYNALMDELSQGGE